MFWGLTIEPGKHYTQTVENSFHVSMAAMDTRDLSSLKDQAKMTQVVVQHDKAEFLLCSLSVGGAFQQPLDLNFTEGEEVTFFTEGRDTVHLTGYLVREEPLDLEQDLTYLDELSSNDEEVSSSEDGEAMGADDEHDEGPSLQDLCRHDYDLEEEDDDDSDEWEPMIEDALKRKKKRKLANRLHVEVEPGPRRSKEQAALEISRSVNDDDDSSEEDEDFDPSKFIKEVEVEDADDDNEDDDDDDEDDDYDEDEDEDEDDYEDDDEDDDGDSDEDSKEQDMMSEPLRRKRIPKEKAELQHSKKKLSPARSPARSPAHKRTYSESEGYVTSPMKKPKNPSGPKQDITSGKSTSKTPVGMKSNGKPGAKITNGETSAGKTLGSNSLNGQTLNGQSPGGKSPGGKSPGGKSPGGKTPGSKTPGSKTPGSKTPSGKTPSGKTPSSKTPSGKTPSGKTPSSKNQNGQTPGSKESRSAISNMPTPKSLTKKTPNRQADTPSKKRKLPCGTVVQDIVGGGGATAKSGKMLSVYYMGSLQNGKMFDSCVDGKPFKFRLGKAEVIKGWDTALAGMRVGGKRRVTIPPSQGYGSKRVGDIPPNSTLSFNIELKDVK